MNLIISSGIDISFIDDLNTQRLKIACDLTDIFEGVDLKEWI
jgi:hypothetical protein